MASNPRNQVGSQSRPAPAPVPAGPPNSNATAFERLLDVFKKELKKKDRDNFQMTTYEGLSQAIGEIQKKQQSERRMQNMTRLKKFTEAINEYGKVIETFCNSSQFVPFIWVSLNFHNKYHCWNPKEYDPICGTQPRRQVRLFFKPVMPNENNMLMLSQGPMKFLLQVCFYNRNDKYSTVFYCSRLKVTCAFSEAFSELLDAYERIGENLPLLLQYETLFPKDPRIGKILVYLYKDILEFHRQAISYFQKPSMSYRRATLDGKVLSLTYAVWKQLFNATWKTFKTRFTPLIDGMAQHREWLERQANLSEIEESRKAQENVNKNFKTIFEAEDYRRRVTVYNWFRAASVEADQDHFSRIRAEYPETGRWLLALENFKNWFDTHFPSIPPLLWINGKPGAGKFSRQLYGPDA